MLPIELKAIGEEFFSPNTSTHPVEVLLCKHHSVKSLSLPPLYGPYPRCMYILLKSSSNVETSWNQKVKNKERDRYFDRHLFIYLEINCSFIIFPRMLLGAKRRLEQNVTHSHLPDLFLLLNE